MNLETKEHKLFIQWLEKYQRLRLVANHGECWDAFMAGWRAARKRTTKKVKAKKIKPVADNFKLGPAPSHSINFLCKLGWHKYVWDSQGAIYCRRCHKFQGWKEGAIKEWPNQFGGTTKEGWGYLLNGPEWTAKEVAKIKKNGGYYY